MSRESALKAWKSKRTPMPMRFWDKVIIKSKNECWNYIGPFQHLGHGSFKLNRKHYNAHRMAWELTFGEIPKGKWILHKCDNPPCCNPKHLYIGTAKENGQDASERKRFPNRKGEKAANAVLTNEQAAKIKREYVRMIVTQKFLADKYGVSESTIQWIVSGRHFVGIN